MSDNELVAPKPWRDRANTLGYLTGGTGAQVNALRQILNQMPCSGKTTLVWTNPGGKEASAICEELCRSQLSSAVLVERTGIDEWSPSAAAAEWMRNDDAVFLARHVHVNVKFFGEMLAAIASDTKQRDLLDVATTIYGMNWTTADQVHRRQAG